MPCRGAGTRYVVVSRVSGVGRDQLRRCVLRCHESCVAVKRPGTLILGLPAISFQRSVPIANMA
jgi:hypothetical protein